MDTKSSMYTQDQIRPSDNGPRTLQVPTEPRTRSVGEHNAGMDHPPPRKIKLPIRDKHMSRGPVMGKGDFDPTVERGREKKKHCYGKLQARLPIHCATKRHRLYTSSEMRVCMSSRPAAAY
ncbi:hypothetical protein EYF80_047426 [Liparis tanakae]|uniref:Uncharacterized protein n=1 Tax=Liparis tanakae TaxID=230148 RepID=A0A4Z2FNS0_9TELE|nr:hypothetical protein EYF80_047426 [Liparis tanakae]